MYLKKIGSYAMSQLLFFRTQCISNKTFESVLRHGIRLNFFSLDNPALTLGESSSSLFVCNWGDNSPIQVNHHTSDFYSNWSVKSIRWCMGLDAISSWIWPQLTKMEFIPPPVSSNFFLALVLQTTALVYKSMKPKQLWSLKTKKSTI